MNMDQFEGKWEQIKGQVKEKWGKLTSDDMTTIRGKKDQMLGKLRERYGHTKEQAERELSGFMKDCRCGTESQPKSKAQPTA
jgi:uncharacterized protein YjbJ (UPF0337 family)